MALDADDKEYFKLLIEGSINTAMKPVMDKLTDDALQLQKLEQSVYGPNGDNGLTGDMKSVKRKIEGFNTKIAWITGIGSGISIAISLFKNKIIGG